MKKRFQMDDLRSVSFDLIMNIKHKPEHPTVNSHQQSYIRTILATFRMNESTLVATPMAMKLHQRKLDKEACDLTLYESMVGNLIYPMTATWPDITNPIGVLSRYNPNPSNEHVIGLKCVFRYLNGTKDWRLCFRGELRGALEGDSALRCYVYSDYAGCPDDYKSTTGLVITFGGAVDWRSRKQKLTVQSTTDAENNAVGGRCMSRTLISHLWQELSILTIAHVFSDSQSLIASMNNRIYRANAVADIATMYYLVADRTRDGEIDLRYVPTAEMLADCFTEPLPKHSFLKQCAATGMIGIGLGNGLGNGHGNGLGNDLVIEIGNGIVNSSRNGYGNDIGTGKGIGNAICNLIDWVSSFWGNTRCMIGSLHCCWLFFLWNGRDSRPGGVLSCLGVQISLCQGLWCILPLL